MFHFILKPKPPKYVGRETLGHAVDSSAIVRMPGKRSKVISFSRLRKSTASRFSRPPIDVIFMEPKQSVGDQIIADLVAPVVIDECAPIQLRALPRIGVFVEVGAIKLS